MTATGEVGPPITRGPRTMVAVCAQLDAVALRIDEAGVAPTDVLTLCAWPNGHEVTVQLRAGRTADFERLVGLFPRVSRDLAVTRDSHAHLVAMSHMGDGSTVRITVGVA